MTTVKVPAEWDGKEIWLEVGRAQDMTWVYVDGKLAGKVTMLLWRGDPCNALGFLDQRGLHFLDGLPSPPWQPGVYPGIQRLVRFAAAVRTCQPGEWKTDNTLIRPV
jgi:hypothetical protein